MIVLSPTEDDVDAAVRSALAAMLPSGTEIVRGQVNRVPEPRSENFVQFTPVHRPRLSTTTIGFADCKLIGSIAGAQMTVTTVDFGKVEVGARVFGVGVAAATEITSQISGAAGGVGVYGVSPSQTVASKVLACGTQSAQQKTDVVYQVEAHGRLGGDNAQRVTTLWQSQFGVDAFAALAAASPLYASDPKQIPFVDGEKQFEDRWIVECHLQVDETVLHIPQQYADSVVVGLIDVDVNYPP